MGGLFLLGALAGSLVGCVTADPPPTRRPFTPIGAAPEATQAGRLAKAKGKGAKTAKGAGAARAKGKVTKAKSPTPAIGVAGPVSGVLSLTPATAADGAAAGTVSSLALTFSDQTLHVEKLGQVPGTCSEVAAAPLTSPQGQSIPVLWSFDCSGTLVHVLQHQSQLLVVTATPPAVEGGRPTMKIVKRLALAPGAVVARKA